MTSSVRIGAQYELAYADHMRGLGFTVSARQAGSKGFFDLVMWLERCWHVQCKAGRLACARAERMNDSLRSASRLPACCGLVIVHKTKKREFCEH